MTDILTTLAPSIQLLVLDVDGVLTDGKISYTSDGAEIKSFHAHDGLGMKRLMAAGIDIAIITNRSSDMVTRRMKELGVTHVYQGAKGKKEAIFDALLVELGLSVDQVAYMGDDLPDLAVMQRVALRATVANAVPAVKAVANVQTQLSGGEGAVRELCDLILHYRDGGSR